MGSPVHQGGCCLTQPRHQAVEAAQPGRCGAQKQRPVTLGQQQGGEGFNVQPQAIEQLGLVLDVHPLEAHTRVRLGQGIEDGPVAADGLRRLRDSPIAL